jgi:hypothetical protein
LSNSHTTLSSQSASLAGTSNIVTLVSSYRLAYF